MLEARKTHYSAAPIRKEKAELKKKVNADDLELEMADIEKAKRKMKKAQTKTIVITVTITIVTLALFVATFVAGVQFEKNSQAEIQREAKSLIQEFAQKQSVKEKQ